MFEFVYASKQGSLLNMTKIELNVLIDFFMTQRIKSIQKKGRN